MSNPTSPLSLEDFAKSLFHYEPPTWKESLSQLWNENFEYLLFIGGFMLMVHFTIDWVWQTPFGPIHNADVLYLASAFLVIQAALWPLIAVTGNLVGAIVRVRPWVFWQSPQQAIVGGLLTAFAVWLITLWK